MLKIKIERDFLTGDVNFFIADKTGNRLALANTIELVFKEIEEYEAGRLLPFKQLKPTLCIRPDYSEDFCGELTKALLEAGFGPKPESNTPELEAVKRHLEDMRTLVFNKPAS